MQHGIALTWSRSDNLPNATFNVYRSTVSGQEQQAPPIATGVSVTNFLDQSGTAGTPYFYVVTEVDNGIESAPSAEATATYPTVPGAPISLAAIAQ